MAFPLEFAHYPPTVSSLPTGGFNFVSKSKVPKPTKTKAQTRPVDTSIGSIEGVVTFPSRLGASYRFEVVAEGERLHIWLEDRKSKKQWRTTQLAMEDFAKDDVVIPHAQFQDYAKCFRDCLAATSDSNCTHDLVPSPDSALAWELRLTLKIRVFTSMWTPTYVFKLDPVSLERVDLLAAKVRDQEDQIAQLTGHIEALSELLAEEPKVPPPVYIRAALTNNVGSGQPLVWKSEGSVVTSKIVFHSSGSIRFPAGGLFVVNAMIQHVTNHNSTTLELQVNSKVVVTCIDSDGNGHQHITPIYHVLKATPNDEIAIIYRGNQHAYTGSYIVLHELR